MGACVLALYRSAVSELLAPWRSAVPPAARRPGLAVHSTADPYQGEARLTVETATALGAEVTTVEGLGHWWMLQDPCLAARMLTDWFARRED